MSLFVLKRNQKLAEMAGTLVEAGLNELIPPPPPPPPKPASKPRAKAGARKRASMDSDLSDAPVAKRSSSRRTAALLNSMTEEEKKADAEEQARIQAEAEAAEQLAKHGPRAVEPLTSVTGSSDVDGLLQEFSALLTFAKKHPSPRKASSPTKTSKMDNKGLQDFVGTLVHRATVKIVPDRIYSMVVHPDPTQDRVFVGDKSGHIGLWNASEAGYVTVPDDGSIRDGSVPPEEEGESIGSFSYWRAHTRHNATISSLKFSPTDRKKIYHSSYDCTLRLTDFETGKSEEVIDIDQFTSEGLVHSFDFNARGTSIWAVDNDGGLTHRDLREPIEEARRWTLDKAKIGCLSINPASDNLAVTSHLKREMRIWDLERILGTPEDATDEQIDKCLIQSYDYVKACSSAYWDPSGTKLLSTSYDDTIRVWDVDPKVNPWGPKGLAQLTKFEPMYSKKHNTQCGAYVSVLRAHWAPAPAQPLHYTIGDMKRLVDVYALDGTLMGGLTDESITAVPAITASHPAVAGKYFGGNSSGKVSFYALE